MKPLEFTPLPCLNHPAARAHGASPQIQIPSIPLPTSHLRPVLHLPGTFSPLKGPPTPRPASHGQASFLPSVHHHLESSAQRTWLTERKQPGTGVLDWMGAAQTSDPSSAWVVMPHTPLGLQVDPSALLTSSYPLPFSGRGFTLRSRPEHPSVPCSTSHPDHLPHPQPVLPGSHLCFQH